MMRRFLSAGAAILAAGLLLAAPAAAADRASAQMKDRSGKDVGTVELVETPNGVLITAKLKGLPPGEHGFHIHAVGKCEPPFASAGGHFNPQEAKHGLMSEEGPHSGDLPNLIVSVSASGEANVQLWNPMVTLQADTDDSLLDQDGSAIVIHAGPDDHKSDPAGNSGDRIACGVVQ